ncbi:F-box protein at5g39450 [Phtheirospermum japonicum]|uniref:F-box protein at5g39450 n=1 Tax=Phtheirospermum japonicum TaxID=374723 RepID=A0A830CUV8_9LAMI|nr:F-box protein at5g39450 [Phtheirospermum japonicum]
MGGLSSKQTPKPNPYYAGKIRSQEKQQINNSNDLMAQVTEEESMENQIADKESTTLSARPGSVDDDDEFYDGIPQYWRSRSLRVTKVSEVSGLLRRAGSVGLERAVAVLDTLGSSVTDLNVTGGFVSRATNKGKNKNNELSIVAFEVANTIVKGSNLMQSLSQRSVRKLKEDVFPAEGVRLLISEDENELLSIVAEDKREELRIFSEEIVRFGNRCKDPQRCSDRNPKKQSKEVAESMMLQMLTLVQLTAELYQELHTLDIIEQEYQRDNRVMSLNLLAMEMKSQRKQVKNLKKKSLWSRNMEKVMGKLVDIVLFLNQEISDTFGNPAAESEAPEKGSSTGQQKLGPAGLALHYANIILLIDSIVDHSSSVPPNSRDTLYQSLPPNLEDCLRSKLQTFQLEEELTVEEIKAEMEKTLHWLVPVATNTAIAHHGFGWVGEWANTRSEQHRRTAGSIDFMRVQTLHHADIKKTEAYIIDLLVWLNYLVNRSKISANRQVNRSDDP